MKLSDVKTTRSADSSNNTSQQSLKPDRVDTNQTVCACCGKIQATQRCSGCRDAPLINGGHYSGASYCDKACQAAHWNVHKADCKKHRLAKRIRALDRAGNLLSQLFFVWREACYDRPLVGVEVEGSSIRLHEDWHRSKPFCKGGLYRPLDNSLLKDKQTKEAVLSFMGCDLSLAFFHCIIRKFFKDITTNVQEVEVVVKGPVRTIGLVDVARGVYETEGPHHVLKVMLENGTTWCVDMTTAQFGWFEVVVPWTRYLVSHCQKVNKIEELGSRSNFYQVMIQTPGSVDDDTREFALWTRRMGDTFHEVIDKIMKKSDMQPATLFACDEQSWRRKKNTLLERSKEEMTRKARELDRMWAEEARSMR